MKTLKELYFLFLLGLLGGIVWLSLIWKDGLLAPQDTLIQMSQDVENYGQYFIILDVLVFFLLFRWISLWHNKRRANKPTNIWETADDRLK